MQPDNRNMVKAMGLEEKPKHWILTSHIMQAIITNLDTNRMTLKAAKQYYLAYGVEIKGRTKEQFIKNLIKAVGDNNNV